MTDGQFISLLFMIATFLSVANCSVLGHALKEQSQSSAEKIFQRIFRTTFLRVLLVASTILFLTAPLAGSPDIEALMSVILMACTVGFVCGIGAGAGSLFHKWLAYLGATVPCYILIYAFATTVLHDWPRIY